MAEAAVHWDRPRGVGAVGRYALLAAIALLVLFPVYTTVIAALKPGNRVLHRPLLPDSFTLDVLGDAWRLGKLDRYLFISAVVAIVVTAGIVVTYLLAAAAFA